MIDHFRGEYSWLSNFSPAEVTLDGVIYPTVENAFQAAKTLDAVERTPFENLGPAQAKKAGRRVTLRSNWNSHRLEIMEHLVREKFSKEPFRSKLLATGSEEIQEGNNWGDTFWGICRGKGENHLGKLIMKIRDEL